ncbi:hypothetical protein [Lelliottia amnigena]|uniref:hypothetical protein n=1 Tax=Lelliottia amnigena TaxID=61646 RepID=UPI003B9E503F
MKSENKTINCLLAVFVLLIAIVIFSYTFNFKGFSISDDPADWGALGDYFGGVLNPLISIVTLFFLVKTYLSQRKELQENEASAQKQLKIANNTAHIHLLQTKITAAYESLSVYHHEMDRVTEATVNNRKFIGMDGKEYYSNEEQAAYRLKMTKKINTELEKINGSLGDLDIYKQGDIKK